MPLESGEFRSEEERQAAESFNQPEEQQATDAPEVEAGESSPEQQGEAYLQQAEAQEEAKVSRLGQFYQEKKQWLKAVVGGVATPGFGAMAVGATVKAAELVSQHGGMTPYYEPSGQAVIALTLGAAVAGTASLLSGMKFYEGVKGIQDQKTGEGIRKTFGDETADSFLKGRGL